MTGKIVVVVVMGLLSSCASSGSSAPTQRPERINRVDAQLAGRLQLTNDPSTVSQTVPFPVDSVWTVLPAVFAQLNIPDTGFDPQQRVYGNRNFRARRLEGKRLSSYIDCGMGATATPNADQYDVTLSVLTDLTALGDTATVVTTTLDATGRPQSVSGNPIHCQSKGTLELRMAQLVMFELVKQP